MRAGVHSRGWRHARRRHGSGRRCRTVTAGQPGHIASVGSWCLRLELADHVDSAPALSAQTGGARALWRLASLAAVCASLVRLENTVERRRSSAYGLPWRFQLIVTDGAAAEAAIDTLRAAASAKLEPPPPPPPPKAIAQPGVFTKPSPPPPPPPPQKPAPPPPPPPPTVTPGLLGSEPPLPPAPPEPGLPAKPDMPLGPLEQPAPLKAPPLPAVPPLVQPPPPPPLPYPDPDVRSLGSPPVPLVPAEQLVPPLPASPPTNEGPPASPAPPPPPPPPPATMSRGSFAVPVSTQTLTEQI